MSYFYIFYYTPDVPICRDGPDLHPFLPDIRFIILPYKKRLLARYPVFCRKSVKKFSIWTAICQDIRYPARFKIKYPVYLDIRFNPIIQLCLNCICGTCSFQNCAFNPYRKLVRPIYGLPCIKIAK